MGKLYTSIINNRITRWVEKKKKVAEEQGGFRPKRSTTDQIFILKEIIQGRRRGKKELSVASWILEKPTIQFLEMGCGKR